MRYATMKRTWPEGDTTSHTWIEVKTDGWLEVTRKPTKKEYEELLLENQKMEQENRYRILTTTRWLKLVSDKGTLLIHEVEQ